MSKSKPSSAHFDNLRKLIDAEEKRTNQSAQRVRISRTIARNLSSMNAVDWHLAGGGFIDLDECDRIVSDFSKRGFTAANGLKISGTELEVADNFSAPDVEITQGIPNQ